MQMMCVSALRCVPLIISLQHLKVTLGPADDARQRVQLFSAPLSAFLFQEFIGHAYPAVILT